jgi:class 3 adenylate cyclase
MRSPEDDASGENEKEAPSARKLTAIVVADVVGYSGLTNRNEVRTLSRLKSVRSEIIDPLLAAHDGRIFNRAGDAFLMEFSSTVEAVRCSLKILDAVEKHGPDLPEEDQLRFRIGAHLGDVAVDGADLLGDAVNIASRIQRCASPGRLCISGAVFDDISNKLATVTFTEMEPQQLKNIPNRVRVYLVDWSDRDQDVKASSGVSGHTNDGDLIAIGPDIVARAEVDRITANTWHFRILHFVLGDVQTLIAFLGSFVHIPEYDRYVLSTALGDGRALSAPPGVAHDHGQHIVTCEVSPRVQRMPAADLKPEWAMSRNYDLELDNKQNFVLVSGLTALPQRITASLSVQRGESPRYPEVGSKLRQHVTTVVAQWHQRLMQLEVIRLASIPFAEGEAAPYTTPLHCVERVRSVEIVSKEASNGWLRIRVELEVNGAGHWTHEVPVIVGSRPRSRADGTESGASEHDRLLSVLAKDCPDGLGRRDYDLQDVQRMLPLSTAQEIEDRVHLLQAEGLVQLRKFFGGKWHLRLTMQFYERVDPDVMGWCPSEDAKRVALRMLNMETGRAAIIHEATGWDRRRFNPAFRHVMDRVPPGSISLERSPLYPAVSILWQPEVRAALIHLG